VGRSYEESTPPTSSSFPRRKELPLLKTSGLSHCALYNLYKIISKIMVNRMRPILTRIISSNQAAFLKGRDIKESILLAHEMVHSMEFYHAEAVCLKADLSKAYDRVEWSFIKNTLTCFGFHPQWIERIMTCVSTPFLCLWRTGRPIL
jgi:hypothetical protein